MLVSAVAGTTAGEYKSLNQIVCCIGVRYGKRCARACSILPVLKKIRMINIWINASKGATEPCADAALTRVITLDISPLAGKRAAGAQGGTCALAQTRRRSQHLGTRAAHV